jgi:hypothetical protein
MNEDQEKVETMPEQAADCSQQELIRDWELLFWAFLLFGLGRLLWLYASAATSRPFQLGISCGFLLCGVLGFLMRYVLTPGLKTKRMANHE